MSSLWFYLFVATVILFVQYVSEVSKVEAAKEARQSTWAYQLSIASRSGLSWSYNKVTGLWKSDKSDEVILSVPEDQSEETEEQEVPF